MNCNPFKMMQKVQRDLLLVMMCAALSGCGSSADLELKSIEAPAAQEEEAVQEKAEPSSGEAGEEEAPPVLIKVFVCGAVANEGVYELPEGARVFEAVAAAGGFAGDADESYVNQADYVSDAQKLYIPTKGEAEKLNEQAGSREESSAAAGSGPVNINTADEAALMTLPGIGQTRAGSIIDYREQNGPFEKAEDLMEVSGIGQAGFDRLKKYITVK